VKLMSKRVSASSQTVLNKPLNYEYSGINIDIIMQTQMQRASQARLLIVNGSPLLIFRATLSFDMYGVELHRSGPGGEGTLGVSIPLPHKGTLPPPG
jgi:hypothetical protein